MKSSFVLLGCIWIKNLVRKKKKKMVIEMVDDTRSNCSGLLDHYLFHFLFFFPHEILVPNTAFKELLCLWLESNTTSPDRGNVRSSLWFILLHPFLVRALANLFCSSTFYAATTLEDLGPGREILLEAAMRIMMLRGATAGKGIQVAVESQ